MANLAPCPGSNLTWVHQLRLSRNLVSMENHYGYEVLMLEAGAEKICTAHLNPCCETEAANESLVRLCTSCAGLNVAFRLELLQVTMQVILGIF